MNKISLCILIFCLSVCKVFSQDYFPPDTINILQEVSIHAERELELSGSKLTKIDSKIIEQKAMDNLSEILSENSTVFIKSYGKGSLTTASFRGTNASHTKVSWNNISLNSPILGMVDFSQIPILITDEITIYHGSASLNRNNSALGGLIELNTKTDWKKGLRLMLVSSVGSFSSFDDLLEIKLGNEKTQSVSKIYYNYSKNDFSFMNSDIIDGKKELRQNADYNKKGFEQELFYRISPNNLLSIKAWYQESDRGVPGLTTNESGVNNKINREDYQMFVYSTEYINIQERSLFELQHGGNYQKSNYISKNLLNGIGYQNIIDSKGESFSIYNTASYKYSIKKNTEFSLRINYNLFNVKSLEKIRNEGYDTLRHEGGISMSLYTSIIKNTKLGILVKQDFYDKKLSPFIPSIFAEYHLNKNNVFKASFARNYNMPCLNDLYFTPGGNPNLLPEKGYSFDFGFQNIIKAKKFLLQSEISFNYNDIRNWILWRPTLMGYWTPDNITKVLAYGLDCNFNLKANLSSDLTLSINANYALTKSENRSETFGENDKSIGKQLPYIPIHSGNIFSQLEYNGYYLTYQWNYYSKRYTGSAAEPDILTSIYPYFMNNMGIGKNLKYKDYNFNISFNIYNLFNESYRSVLWQPMPGINYSLQLIIKFR